MKKSNQIIIGSSILLLLGLLGLASYMVFGKKKNKNNHSKTPETPKDGKDKKVTKKNVQKKLNLQLGKGTFKTPDELIKLISKRVLKLGHFTSPEEFLEKLIRGCGMNIGEDKYDWYEFIPRNREQLEEKLKELSLFDEYMKCL